MVMMTMNTRSSQRIRLSLTARIVYSSYNKWSKEPGIRPHRRADGRLNRIRQVAPMCPPMTAHWRHLANSIELVLPSAHPNPRAKRQIDRFSHFCATHGRMSSDMPGHILSPYCPFARGIWAPSNNASLGPQKSITHMIQPF